MRGFQSLARDALFSSIPEDLFLHRPRSMPWVTRSPSKVFGSGDARDSCHKNSSLDASRTPGYQIICAAFD